MSFKQCSLYRPSQEKDNSLIMVWYTMYMCTIVKVIYNITWKITIHNIKQLISETMTDKRMKWKWSWNVLETETIL